MDVGFAKMVSTFKICFTNGATPNQRFRKNGKIQYRANAKQ